MMEKDSSITADLKGLLIDYEYCTGCHSCEVACKKTQEMEIGQYGITVVKDGPRKKLDGTWEYNFIPIPTEDCDLCVDRISVGKKPRCVHHCQALVMSFGTVSELAAKIDKSQMVLFVPKNQ